jgi:hypothetical protein
MPDRQRTKRAREIQQAIRRVLVTEWDPCQVNDNPDLHDEYDAYIGGVYHILNGTRSESELAHYLSRSEGKIGVQAQSPDQLVSVAKTLLALNVELKSDAG